MSKRLLTILCALFLCLPLTAKADTKVVKEVVNSEYDPGVYWMVDKSSLDIRSWRGPVYSIDAHPGWTMKNYLDYPTAKKFWALSTYNGHSVIQVDPGRGAYKPNYDSTYKWYLYDDAQLPDGPYSSLETDPNRMGNSNPLILFQKNIDTFWNRPGEGEHLYPYEMEAGETIPLAGWIASSNWASIHHDIGSKNNPTAKYGSIVDWEGVSYKITESCWYPHATAWNWVCAYCGQRDMVLNYGSQSAHEMLPALEVGAAYVGLGRERLVVQNKKVLHVEYKKAKKRPTM